MCYDLGREDIHGPDPGYLDRVQGPLVLPYDISPPAWRHRRQNVNHIRALRRHPDAGQLHHRPELHAKSETVGWLEGESALANALDAEGEWRVRRPRPGVVSGVEHRADTVEVDALHHAEWFVVSGNGATIRVQFLA